MFSTETNLKFVSEPDIHLFADGTFQYCPKFYYQLYTIHVFRNGQYIPCAFFLLPDKTKQTYINMFQHLVQSCPQSEVNIDISVLHLDFEIAVHEAVLSIWPNVLIKACQFHLGQAWYRKIQNLGLSGEYKDSASDIGKWLKKFFGLSYLESADVADCFAFNILQDAPDNEKAMKFADYVLNTYVDERAKFHSRIWADPNLYSKRTTNGCENFHRQLGAMFYSSHPNIFDFAEKLKTIQTNNYLKIRASMNGIPMENPQKQKIVNMREIQNDFITGIITRTDDFRKIAYTNLPIAEKLF